MAATASPREFVARESARATARRARRVASTRAATTKPRCPLIGRRAGVSKSDFYKHFESKDDCFFAAYDEAVERIRARRRRAPARVEGRVGARVLRRPRRGCSPASPPSRRWRDLLLVEGLRAGRGVYDRYQARGRELRPAICATARRRGPAAAGPPEATDEAVVGGIASLLGRRVLAGEAARPRPTLPGTCSSSR